MFSVHVALWSVFMRIITGRFKRRKLLANPGLITRPISDRVKETLFQRLGDLGLLAGRRIADVFAGTGTIGLEALSRGGQSVVFFELDRIAFDLLKKNVATLGVEDECVWWQTDILRTSFRPKGAKSDFAPYSLVFFDPPYKMAPDLKAGTRLNASLERLGKDTVTTPDVVMVVRVPDRTSPTFPAPWVVDWTLKTSHMDLHICRKAAAGEVVQPAASITVDDDGSVADE